MIDQVLIDLIDELRALPNLRPWVAFRMNYRNPIELGQYLSGLANAASIAKEPNAYLIFGAHGNTQQILGTEFDPDAVKTNSGNNLIPWILEELNSSIGLTVSSIIHPHGRIVVFNIHIYSDGLVLFQSIPYLNTKSGIVSLTR